MQGNRPEIIMPQTFAVILFLNSFKIFPTLCFYSHIILNKWSKKNIVDACYTAAFNIVLQARDSKGCIWGTDKSVFRRQRQINYTIHALICASVATASHFHHVEQTGSLHHTPYFLTETLAIILELFSILYCCYYSQNYSSIIISGLKWKNVGTDNKSTPHD